MGKLKIGYIKGVNIHEDREMITTLNYAYNHSTNHLGQRLQIMGMDLDLPKIHQPSDLQPEETYKYKRWITEVAANRFRLAIHELVNGLGATTIIVPYGAQQYLSHDCLPKIAGCRIIYDLYEYMRRRIKQPSWENVLHDAAELEQEDVPPRVKESDSAGIDLSYKAEQVLTGAGFFAEPQAKRSLRLHGLGVIGLSRPAEAFSGANCLKECIEDSYRLITPISRLEVWQQLDRAFYDPQAADITALREYCSKELGKMEDFYWQYYDKNGLEAVVVTDFWTEQYLSATPVQPDQIIGQTQLPSGRVLPLLNLERIEAWAIIDELTLTPWLERKLYFSHNPLVF